MPRVMDDALSADLREQASPHALLAFLTITNLALSDPIRVVSDPLDFVVDGETFVGCPFTVDVVPDLDSHPTAQIRLPNVSREIGAAVQAAVGRIAVAVEIRSTAGFDLSVVPRTETADPSLILSYQHFELVDVSVNDVEVAGTLMMRDYSQEPWPARRATKSRCPALFR